MNKSVRKLLNCKEIDNGSVLAYDKTVHYFFLINPFNLSVLSDSVITGKIFSFLNVLKGFSDLEIIALNQRENFEQNKIYLKKRLSETHSEKMKELILKDINMLDQIQSEIAASRQFIISVQFTKEKNFEIIPFLNRLLKLFNSNGFEVKLCTQEEVMAMLALYYEQNSTTEIFDLIDGSRWVNV